MSEPIRLFLDDERDPPKGWTLHRTTETFLAALDAAVPQRLEAVSLDWHLGRDVPNANVALDGLIARMRAHPERFPMLKRVHFHSSDPNEAHAMTMRFADFIRETLPVWRANPRLPMMDASMPWDE